MIFYKVLNRNFIKSCSSSNIQRSYTKLFFCFILFKSHCDNLHTKQSMKNYNVCYTIFYNHLKYQISQYILKQNKQQYIYWLLNFFIPFLEPTWLVLRPIVVLFEFLPQFPLIVLFFLQLFQYDLTIVFYGEPIISNNLYTFSVYKIIIVLEGYKQCCIC